MAGVIDDARDLGGHDHLCWAYQDPESLRSRVRDFLAEGLAQGLRVNYIASGDIATLVADLRELDGLEAALRRGAAQVTSLEAMYPVSTVIEPATQVQAYAAATEEALAAGFTGLRVAVEATQLVRTPHQLEAFARYEHLVDRYIASRPFSAMCAYHCRELGQEAIAQLACLHPNTNSGAAGFRLHASTGAAAALNGELDLATVRLFGLALERADLRPTGDELVIDAAKLSFMDHRNLAVLVEHARRCGARLVLRTGWSGATRLLEVLGVPDVRMELPA